MKTGRMKSDGMGEMGAFENELQWTIAFSGIGKKSGEWEHISHPTILINHSSQLFFFFFFSCFPSVAQTFLMPLSPSPWLGKILLTSQSGRSAY